MIKRVEVICSDCVSAEYDRYSLIWLSGTRYGTCQYDNCFLKPVGRGFCTNHRNLILRLTKFDTRPMNPRGSGSIDSNGYRKMYDPKRGKAVAEHILTMESFLGRVLVDGENVHHKNGDRLDNRIENLELWSSSQPPGQRVIDKYEWALSIIELYGKDIENDKIV